MSSRAILVQIVKSINDMAIEVRNSESMIQDFLKNYPVQPITKLEMDRLEANLDDGMPEIDSMSEISMRMRFKADKLQEFLTTPTNDENIHYYVPFLMANAVAFLFQLATNELNAEFELLLKCFHKVTMDTYHAQVNYITRLVGQRTLSVAIEPFPSSLIAVYCGHLRFFAPREENTLVLLTLMLKMAFKTNDATSLQTVYSIVIPFLKSTVCENVIRTHLIPTLEARLQVIEKHLFQVIGILGTMQPDPDISRLYSSLPHVVLHFISENADIFENVVMQTCDELPCAVLEARDFVNHSADELVMDSVTDVALDVFNFKVELCFPEGLIPSAKLILMAFEEVRPEYTDVFLEAFSALVRKTNSENLLLTFLYFLSKIKNIKKLGKWAIDTLITPYFFNPSVTMFNQKLTVATNLFRATIIKIICIYGHEWVPAMLDKFVFYPYLFPEILTRLHYCFKDFMDGITVMFDDRVFQNLMAAETNLRTVGSMVDDTLKQVVASARLKIFSFAFALFRLENVPESCYASPFFTTSFISAFCEPALKHLMFAQMQSILSNENTSKQIVEFLTSSVRINLVIPGKEEIAMNLLRCLGECLHRNPRLADPSIALFRSVIECMPMVCEVVSVAILKFGAQVAHQYSNFEMRSNDIMIIASALNKTDIDDVRISCLIGLFAQSMTHGYGSLFLLEQPSVAILLMSVFSMHGRTQEFFTYIKRLAEFSIYNKCQLHKGEFDLLLLEMIYHSPNGCTFRGCEFGPIDDSQTEEFLNLFLSINAFQSSLVAANKLMKILSPRRNDKPCKISDRGIPDTSGFDLLESTTKLNNLVAAKFRGLDTDRLVEFPFAVKKHVCSKQITFPDLTSHLCFSMCIHADGQLARTLNMKAYIFSIEDEIGPILEVYMQGCSLLMTVCTETTMMTMMLVEEFPMSKHVKLVLEVSEARERPGTCKVKSYLDGKYPQSANVTFVKLPDDKLLNVSFGQVPENEPTGKQRDKYVSVYQMKGASMYTRILKTDEIKNFAETNQSPENPFYTVSVQTDVKNLYDIIRMELPIELYIPHLIFMEKYKWNQRVMIFDTMAMLFGSRITSMFPIIAKLLRETDPSVLIFNFYMRITRWIEWCTTNEQCHELYDNILCNFDVWRKSKQIDRILMHWSSGLFESFPKYFKEVGFFDKMMYILDQLPSDQERSIEAILRLIHIRIVVHGLDKSECEYIFGVVCHCESAMAVLDILISLNVPFHEDCAKIIVKIPFLNTSKNVIRVVKCLQMCVSWRSYMAGVIYRVSPDVDEEELRANSKEIPELMFCVLWTKLVKKEPIDDGIINAVTPYVSKLTLSMGLLLVLLAVRDPAKIPHVAAMLANFLEQCGESEEICTLMDIIDVFGNRELACVLCNIRYEACLVSGAPYDISKLIISCYRALFVSRRKMLHQSELVGEADPDPMTDWNSIADLMKMIEHEYVYTVIPRDTTDMGAVEHSLCQFCAIRNEALPASVVFAHEQILSPVIDREKFFDFQNLDPILTDIRAHSEKVLGNIGSFLSKINQLSMAKRSTHRFKSAQLMSMLRANAERLWKRVLIDHMHQDSVWQLSSYIWQRDMYITERMTSFRLKRSLKYHREKCQIHMSETENCICRFECRRIKLNSSTVCTLLGYSNRINIFNTTKITTIMHDHIKHIMFRSRHKQPTAIEFFLSNGSSILLDFAPVKASAIIKALRIPRAKVNIYQSDESYEDLVDSSKLVSQYHDRRIGSLEFLLKLNMLCGRSYLDPAIYPIVPFLETDITRDISVPSCVQNSDKCQQLMSRIEEVGYCFTTAPSNGMTLSYFLVRHEPFTKLHYELNDRKFDVPDRMFVSIDTYKTAMAVGITSTEACPELFTMPEAFMALNPNGSGLGDLAVPEKFASLFEYVYVMRTMLEKTDVSPWVDLMFGVNLNRANKFNVYSPDLHPDFTPGSSDCVIDSDSLTQLGIIPPRVFRTAVGCRKQPTTGTNRLNTKDVNVPIKNAFFVTNLYLVGEDDSFYVVSSKTHKIEPIKCEPCTYICHNSIEALLKEKNGKKIIRIRHGEIRDSLAEIDFKEGIMLRNGANGTLISASRDGLIEIRMHGNFGNPTKVQIMSDNIACIGMSTGYGVFIYGTRGGTIGVYSLTTMTFINSCNIGDIPVRISVTPNMGFIVVYSIAKMWLFTINGFLMKTCELDFKINHMCVFDRDGLDYICMSDTFGHLWCFEAFYPENRKSLGYCGNKELVSLDYDPISNMIVTASASGVIYYIDLLTSS